MIRFEELRIYKTKGWMFKQKYANKIILIFQHDL